MRRRVVLWLIVLSGWTLVAAAFAVGSSLTYMITYQPPQWGRTFVTSLIEWYPWAALTPLVVWLARRLPLDSRRWLRRAIVLAALGVPVAMLRIVIGQILRSLSGVGGYAVPGNLVAQYLIYWGIIGIAHVVAYYAAEGQRELRASRAEARLAETRLQLLKTQLHPHFLFNTLNTISELVHEDPPAADKMLTGLSQLLRETLDAGTVDLVPLARELEILNRYVDIQRARFGDRLDVRFEIADDVRRALLPIFILQPLVENAIRHGVSTRAEGGRIVVRARREGNRAAIEIEDDGPGIRTADLKEGVGLRNTRARLQEAYGSEHAFDIRRAGANGTIVGLSVPWQLEVMGQP